VPLKSNNIKKRKRIEKRPIILFFLKVGIKKLSAEQNIIRDKNKIAFGAEKMRKIPIDPMDPIAAPERSEAYNLKLFSAKSLKN